MANTGGVDDAKLRSAGREARLEAAPFAFAIVIANGCLAVVSRYAGWELFGRSDWWLWLVVGAPSVLLFATFAIGPQRLGLDHLRRELAKGLLGLLWVGTTAGTRACHCRSHCGRRDALLRARRSCSSRTSSFSLVFWEPTAAR
jgi:hypothetical protein